MHIFLMFVKKQINDTWILIKLLNPQGRKFHLYSVFHIGTQIPNHLLKDFNPKQLQLKDDTDWFLDQLYDFAPKLGITTIKATTSRCWW